MLCRKCSDGHLWFVPNLECLLGYAGQSCLDLILSHTPENVDGKDAPRFMLRKVPVRTGGSDMN